MNEVLDDYDEVEEPFCTLGFLLLQGISVGLLVTAIEQNGIYGWDRFARKSKADEERISKVYDVLASFLDTEHTPIPFDPYIKGQLTELKEFLDDNFDHTFNIYGWWSNICPDFAEIKIESMNVVPRFEGPLSEKRKKQLKIICDLISALKVDKMHLPKGSKAKLLGACLINPGEFTESIFDHAWQAGLDNNLFRLADHEKYSPK